MRSTALKGTTSISELATVREAKAGAARRPERRRGGRSFNSLRRSVRRSWRLDGPGTWAGTVEQRIDA